MSQGKDKDAIRLLSPVTTSKGGVMNFNDLISDEGKSLLQALLDKHLRVKRCIRQQLYHLKWNSPSPLIFCLMPSMLS